MDVLNYVVGVEEAARLWQLSPGYIKNLAAEELIKAKKIGKTWVIDIRQPTPKQVRTKNEKKKETIE